MSGHVVIFKSSSHPRVWGGGLASLVAFVMLSPSWLLAEGKPQAEPPAVEVDFVRDVQPVLAAHCVRCHGPRKQRGDLRVDSRSGLLKGGSRGPAVVPGRSAASLLLTAVSQQDADLSMPPEGEPLSAAETETLRRWIEAGAPGPADDSAFDRPLPWSFQPVRRPPLAASSDAIDELVLNRLREVQLEISPQGDRPTLIRRLHLILHGLPPTPEEVVQFENDDSADAYERLVERVLASPRYGERWARHWLDIVRFAESNGFETNRVRENAWPYRDYLIGAFNEDKPYDQFIREQLAGDSLAVDAATGYLVAGAYDIVKSPDINLTLMQRQDELADMVNTTGTAFLGLTLGCARCHDHKFDPVTQVEFYAVQGVFAGVNFASRPLPAPRGEAETRELAELRQRRLETEERVERLRQVALKKPGQPTLRPAVRGTLNDEAFEPVRARGVRFTIEGTNNGEPCLDELEVFDQKGTNVALASEGATATASGTLPGYPDIHRLEFIHDGRTGNSRSWISDRPGRGWIRIDFAGECQVEKIVWGRDRAGQFGDRLPTKYRIELLVGPEQWRVVASSEDRLAPGSDQGEAFLAQLSPAEAQLARKLLAESAAQQRRIDELSHGRSAWLGTFSPPGEVHRLHRGDPLQKREVVPPGAPAALGGLPLSPTEPEALRRLKFADWIANPRNPLTARVMANRVWHYTFGTGIVETPSDFGGNGALPLNPELLDWLADEFVRGGWSVKHLHRLVVLSRTFRQSSTPHAAGLAADADARRLWRFPPRRMEAEVLRDGILSVSGSLDPRMGGPGFFLQIVEPDNVFRYFPKEQVGPPEFRRMVYLSRVRQEQDPVFGAFDCPSGNQVTPKRSRSNTPLQALNLFNSPFMLRQAELFANRLQREAGDDARGQVTWAFVLTTARRPDEFELQESIAMIREHGLPAFCRALLNTSEFLFVF